MTDFGRTVDGKGEGAPVSVPSRTLNSVKPAIPYLAVLAIALSLPLFGNEYWAVIGARAAVYWVLVAGLNLMVGFAGQLALGYVVLLLLGAYTASILVGRDLVGPILAFVPAAVVGAVASVIICLPAMRLRTFYFAMTTVGFSTIATQVALAWRSVTNGGMGLLGPVMPAPFDQPWGYYLFCLTVASLCTWMTANIAGSRFGRGLLAFRDVEVAAEAVGLSKGHLLMPVFLFSGALAGIAGHMFATLQTYITPDAFTFELSVLFFIAILIGGRGSILGPLLGTIILTVLPEFAAPLVVWSTFLYAGLLLLIVLLVPGGISDLLDFENRKPLQGSRGIVTRPQLLEGVLSRRSAAASLVLRKVSISFGGVQAISELDLEIGQGQVHGLIGPNGSGKTTTLNVISGYNVPDQGDVLLGQARLPHDLPQRRAHMRIARTFQTPRIIGEASVVQNVMIGGTIDGKANFVETMLWLPRQRDDEKKLRTRALLCLQVVGIDPTLADVRADRLQHSELRFVEIARALMLDPAFVLMDEPAAGLSAAEIGVLGKLIREIGRLGVGVLLVEHHADLIFDICDHVTVLNLGRKLAAGTPAEVRTHREVVSAYLGG